MPPKRILVLHNRYRQAGGEDHVFAQEVALLRGQGHTVIEYVDSNDRLDESHPIGTLVEAIWSRATVGRLEKVIADTRPDIAHFHNTFLMISPAAYYACRRAGLAVVQTLHNFRMGCLNGCCTIGGRPCQTCVPMSFAGPGIWNGCYRDSRLASAAVAGISVIHKTLGTYRNQVDAYISTSEFARDIHLRSGVPAEMSFVKPNFSPQPAPSAGATPRGYGLYAGRMTRDKGVYVLLEAWSRLRPGITLKLCGDGPDAEDLQAKFAHLSAGVEFLGAVPRARVQELMSQADFFIHPSLLLENCALVVIEAFSAGLPCIGSGHGSFTEIVEHGRTGLHFRPGNSVDLTEKLDWMISHREEVARMGRMARERYDQNYSPKENYRQLMQIYDAAEGRRRASQHQ